MISLPPAGTTHMYMHPSLSLAGSQMLQALKAVMSGECSPPKQLRAGQPAILAYRSMPTAYIAPPARYSNFASHVSTAEHVRAPHAHALDPLPKIFLISHPPNPKQTNSH
jgi:hypothetical protein